MVVAAFLLFLRKNSNAPPLGPWTRAIQSLVHEVDNSLREELRKMLAILGKIRPISKRSWI